MKNLFISLGPSSPCGFDVRKPTRRDLLGSRVALFAESLDMAISSLDGLRERVCGAVITEGNAFSHSIIGPELWHLVVPRAMFSSLYDVASCFLDLMSHGQGALNENKSLKIELARSRRTQRQTRESYDENSERLGQRIEELRQEIKGRQQAEKERLELETKILQAQKLESLAVLAGGIAHDLNNLLVGILGNADLALMDLSPTAPARENLHGIEIAAMRAADLAKQMLAYSGKGRFIVKRLELQSLIEEMVHLVGTSISKKVVVKLDFAAGVPPIEADATQIRQIIMNLVINASEAIGDRSGVISIRTGAMDCDRNYLDETFLDDDLPEGAYSYIEVSDTGCGMTMETRARIFDPFFTTKFTGRGLGLAAVLGIVRGHKGAIKVYSEQDRGTTFKVLFPVVEGTISPDPTQVNDRDNNSLKGYTVLLVDDEETVRTVARRMLERIGMKVRTAEDGRQALALVKAEPDAFDCILLDLTMPHMDGEETFREIRLIRGDIPVVLSSGYNQQDLINRFAGKGLAGFIQKPYQVVLLREVLLHALSPA